MAAAEPSPVALSHQNLLLLPILHGRLECAALVRQAFLVQPPDAIAVELPPTLETAVLQAVSRLPLLSVVHYQDSHGQTVYWPIEPTDPLVEAIRLGVAGDVPVHFIDRDMENYPRVREALPDPYALTQIGLEAYAEAYRRTSQGVTPLEPDRLREQAMAYHLQELQQHYQRLLVVFGLAHYPGLLTQLAQPQAQPLARTRRPGVQVAHLAEDSSREILTEIPLPGCRLRRLAPGNSLSPTGPPGASGNFSSRGGGSLSKSHGRDHQWAAAGHPAAICPELCPGARPVDA